MDHKQWSDLAADRVAWRHLIHQTAAQFEVDSRNSLKDKRQRRKARAASTTTPDITFPCGHCFQAEVSSTETMILKYQLQGAGHVSSMEDHRLPKIIM